MIPAAGLEQSSSLLAPFVFTGHLTGYLTPPGAVPQPAAFQLALFGSGTATAMFTQLRDPSGLALFELSHASYDFAPIPEPATGVLVATALAAGLARRRLRRRAER